MTICVTVTCMISTKTKGSGHGNAVCIDGVWTHRPFGNEIKGMTRMKRSSCNLDFKWKQVQTWDIWPWLRTEDQCFTTWALLKQDEAGRNVVRNARGSDLVESTAFFSFPQTFPVRGWSLTRKQLAWTMAYVKLHIHIAIYFGILCKCKVYEWQHAVGFWILCAWCSFT